MSAEDPMLPEDEMPDAASEGEALPRWANSLPDMPDCWPPEEPELRGGRAPIFALPGIFLFPLQVRQLHIFEPRYRQMVEDILDGPGRFILATTEEGAAESHTPPILPIAGLGEVMRHQKLPDGRFLIHVFGLCRVRLSEIPSERLYRQADYEVLEDAEGDPVLAEKLLTPLRDAILERNDDLLNLPADVPIGLLSDLLLTSIEMPQAEMARVFVELSATSRAERALEAHSHYPRS